jgi:tRNA1(Val) A37 N6-methylase TrmN6
MYPKVNSSEALLVILEAKNNAREGMKVLPPIFMYNEDGTYTDDALEIFNFKKQN